MEPYQKEYHEFVEAFKSQPVSGFEAGELIARMAEYFSDYNVAMVTALREANKVRKECESQVDANGKAISSTKAEVMASATDEYHAYQVARAHVQNIEQIINAVKALQKGLLSEYATTSSL